MPSKLACALALMLVVVPLQTARADDPRLIVRANLGIDNVRNELAAESAFRERLDRFGNWLRQQSGAHRNYSDFDVQFARDRPPQLRADNPEWDANLVAILWATSTGDRRVEAHADIDIGRSEALSALSRPQNVFQPVIGIIFFQSTGGARAVVRMYESFVIYSVLVRALEEGVRARGTQGGRLDDFHLRTVNLIAAYLTSVTREARKDLGGGISPSCLTLIEANAGEIVGGALDPDVRRRFRRAPAPKSFNCS